MRWEKTTTERLINEGLLKIGDGYRAKNSEFTPTGLPFARAGNINNGFLFSNADRLPEYYKEVVGDKTSELGDIVFTSKGTVGRFGFVTEKIQKFVYSPQLCFWRSLKKDKIIPKFIYYWMHGAEFVGQAEVLKGQTDMADYVNLADQRKMQITLPLPSEQKAIASVLSSLDDKIDLLHRQNATLEGMAEALFRQWFVVEAKEDWEEKRLGDFFPVKTGKKDANYSVEYGGYPFFTCSKQTLCAPDYSFDGSAILLAGNGDFNVKRYSGKFEAYQRTYVLIPYTENDFNFLYVIIKFFLHEITEGHRGSVINFITKGMIEDFTIAMPPDNIMPKLNYFNKIYAKIDANIQQIRTLEILRDALLPKLISGDVHITY